MDSSLNSSVNQSLGISDEELEHFPTIWDLTRELFDEDAAIQYLILNNVFDINKRCSVLNCRKQLVMLKGEKCELWCSNCRKKTGFRKGSFFEQKKTEDT